MDSLSCKEICAALQVLCPAPDLFFSSVSTDSRSIAPGTLFVALSGDNYNGHDYIAKAIEKGAAGVLISKDIDTTVPQIKVSDTLLALGQIAHMYRNKFSIPMVAVTGSCGKTTVKNMITSILQLNATVLSPTGSFNNEIGLPKTLLQLDAQHKYAVLEMGAKRAGDIRYLMGLVNPQISMVNNVAPAHLESFGDLDGIAKAKGEIYDCLRDDGTAVINIDDVYAPLWLSKLTTQQVITFGLESAADITCSYIVEEHHQLKFELVTDIGKTEVIMPILGTHNVHNALAATAVARALSIPLAQIKAGLEAYRPTERRMKILLGKQGARIIDDSYNANPIAMQRAIAVLAKQNGRKVMVIGDMLELGSDEVEIHKTLGQQIKSAAIDELYAFGKLSQHAATSYGARANFYTDKSMLTQDLLQIMDKDTVVLVKGSNGMHLEEIINVIVAE